MKTQCCLCKGDMVREKDVDIQLTGGNLLVYALAWVCMNCGTAFPIAIVRNKLFGKPKSLFENGHRAK